MQVIHRVAALVNQYDQLGSRSGHRPSADSLSARRLAEAALAVHDLLRTSRATASALAALTPRSSPLAISRLQLVGEVLALPGDVSLGSESVPHHVLHLVTLGTRPGGVGFRSMRATLAAANDRAAALAALHSLFIDEADAPGS